MAGAATLLEHAVALLLVLGRTASFLAAGPVLRRLPVPRLPATGLVLVVALLIEGAGLGPRPADLAPSLALAFRLSTEVAIGLLLGLLANLVFESMRLAGELVGLSMGLSAATLFNPEDHSQGSLAGTFYGLVAGLAFFLVDGHHALLRLLVLSYRVAPIGTASIPPGAGEALVAMAGALFGLGLRIAAPVLTALLLTDLAMAILGRAVPQMPVYFVVLPLKIGIGIALMIVTLPAVLGVLGTGFDHMEADLLRLVEGL